MGLYRLYGAGTTSTDGLAALDIRDSGMLYGIAWDAYFEAAAARYGVVELSFAPTNQVSSNDVTQVISTVTFAVIAAAQATRSSIVLGDIEIPVNAGERLYLNLYSSGVLTTMKCFCTILVKDKLGRSQVTRR
jgi:hypothetical protein